MLEFRRVREDFRRKRFGSASGANRVRAECVAEGDEAVLRMYVDDVRLSETRHSGRLGEVIGIGIFAYSQAGGTDVRFDDVLVRPLPD